MVDTGERLYSLPSKTRSLLRGGGGGGIKIYKRKYTGLHEMAVGDTYVTKNFLEYKSAVQITYATPKKFYCRKVADGYFIRRDA